MEKDQNWDEFIQTISEMAEVMNQNAHQIYLMYEPVVERLCRWRAAEDEVNHCFDTLLDYGFDDNVLSLFKKLSRHYYRIYPDSVLFYVKECVEMWCAEYKEKDDMDIDTE